MFGLGVPEILVIAVIILLIFGAKRLPGIGEGLGKTVKELKNIKKDVSGGEKAEKKEIEGPAPEAPKDQTATDGTAPALQNQASEESDASASEDPPAEDDMVDAFQKKMTKKVTDKVLGQVPGIKQAKQLKGAADKIKKIVS
jgi:sec-independent protein translocase protein TatA